MTVHKPADVRDKGFLSCLSHASQQLSVSQEMVNSVDVNI